MPLEDGVDFLPVHGDSFGRDNESKEFDCGLVEVTPLEFGVQSMFAEFGQDKADVFHVFCRVLGVHKDVVKVCNNKVVEVLAEDVVHEVLKYCWCVCEAERHDCILKVAVSSPKCCCLFVPFPHLYQVVCPTKIDLGEDFCRVQLVEEAQDEGQCVSILDSDAVEALVVDA